MMRLRKDCQQRWAWQRDTGQDWPSRGGGGEKLSLAQMLLVSDGDFLQAGKMLGRSLQEKTSLAQSCYCNAAWWNVKPRIGCQ